MKIEDYSSDIQKTVTNLKVDIDTMYFSSKTVKSRILELAKILDESKHYERTNICKKIITLLEDKIKEKKLPQNGSVIVYLPTISASTKGK